MNLVETLLTIALPGSGVRRGGSVQRDLASGEGFVDALASSRNERVRGQSVLAGRRAGPPSRRDHSEPTRRSRRDARAAERRRSSPTERTLDRSRDRSSVDESSNEPVVRAREVDPAETDVLRGRERAEADTSEIDDPVEDEDSDVDRSMGADAGGGSAAADVSGDAASAGVDTGEKATSEASSSPDGTPGRADETSEAQQGAGVSNGSGGEAAGQSSANEAALLLKALNRPSSGPTVTKAQSAQQPVQGQTGMSPSSGQANKEGQGEQRLESGLMGRPTAAPAEPENKAAQPADAKARQGVSDVVGTRPEGLEASTGDPEKVQTDKSQPYRLAGGVANQLAALQPDNNSAATQQTHTQALAADLARLLAGEHAGAIGEATPREASDRAGTASGARDGQGAGPASPATNVVDSRPAGPVAAQGRGVGATNLAQPSGAGTGDPAVRNEAVDRVVQVVRSNIGSRNAQVTLRLEPPDLGSVRIDVQLRGEALALRAQVETATARDLLVTRSAELRQALEQHGITVDRFDVEIRSPHQAHAQQRDGGDGAMDQQGGQQRPAEFSSGGETPAGQRDDDRHEGAESYGLTPDAEGAGETVGQQAMSILAAEPSVDVMA